MALQVWFEEAIRIELQRQADVGRIERYGHSGNEVVLTGVVNNEGVISHLGKDFVLGKVKFWKSKGQVSDNRIPFVRVDNHGCYPQGMVLSPIRESRVRYEDKRKTLDQTTPLYVVRLLSSSDGRFVSRVFSTWENGVLVPKFGPRDSKLLVYCHEKNLPRLEGR